MVVVRIRASTARSAAITPLLSGGANRRSGPDISRRQGEALIKGAGLIFQQQSILEIGSDGLPISDRPLQTALRDSRGHYVDRSRGSRFVVSYKGSAGHTRLRRDACRSVEVD